MARGDTAQIRGEAVENGNEEEEEKERSRIRSFGSMAPFSLQLL